MSTPNPLYVLTTSGESLTIANAAGNPTITPRLIYDGSLQKFGLGASEVGGGMGGAFSTTDGTTNLIQATAYWSAKGWDGQDHSTSVAAASPLGKHDHFTLTMPRYKPKLVSFMEWWDAALVPTTQDTAWTASPGFKHIATISGPSGSCWAVVDDIGMFTVGQGISSAGDSPVPVGTIITGLYVSPDYGWNASPVSPIPSDMANLGNHFIRLSKSLVASATDAVVNLAGSNLVGRIIADRFLAISTSPATNIT